MSRYVHVIDWGCRNFYRFGDNWQIFTLDEGITNIFGKNGSGKSTAQEILHFTFFGESYRGSNLDKLINRSNKSNLETFARFYVTENGMTNYYKICRGLAPKIEKLYKDDSTDAEHIPGKFNAYISEKILGFNSNINKKIISVHSKNGSFLTMPLDERRKIIDSIVNLTQTKAYLVAAKSALSDYTTKRTLVLSEIEMNTKQIVPYKLLMNKTKENSSNNLLELRKRLSSVNAQAIKLDSDEDNICNEIKLLELELKNSLAIENKLKTEYMAKDPNSVNQKYSDLVYEFKTLQNKAKEIKNEISKINPDVVCSHCGNTYTVDQANTKRSEKKLEYDLVGVDGKRVKNEMILVEAEIAKLKLDVAEISAQSDKTSDIKNNIQMKNYNISTIKQQRIMSNHNIKQLEGDIDAIINAEPEEDTIDVSAKIEELEDKLLGLNDTLLALNDNIEATQYIIKMFSDEGIKALVLKKFLPTLNKLINYYLKTFNINVNFTLTSDYGYTMTADNGLSDEFIGLSGGQQQRINLSILFAQTDLIKIMGNFKTNLLFLDEFIDGGVDDEGLDETFKILKKICDRDGKSIVVISHKLNENIVSELDHFYHALKVDDNYSTLNAVSREYAIDFMNSK